MKLTYTEKLRRKFARRHILTPEEQRTKFLRSLEPKEETYDPEKPVKLIGNPRGVGQATLEAANWPDGPRVMRRESTSRGFYAELARYDGGAA